MAKVFKNIRPISRGIISGKYGVTNDCSVRALANAAGMMYSQADELCTRYGRKMNDGFAYSDYHRLLVDNGFNVHGVFGSTYNAKHFGLFVGGSYKRYAGITIEKALTSVLAEGTFIVMRRGHFFCVIDGEIIDATENTGAQSVQIVWKLKD